MKPTVIGSRRFGHLLLANFRKKLHLVLLAVFVTAATAFYHAAHSSRTLKVLVFFETKGYRHESIPDGIALIQNLGKKHGFLVDTTKNSETFTQKNLKKYKVIVFLNTTGDVLSEEQQSEMVRWLQAGNGFVGVHAAADTEYDWPWYGELVCAYFNGHPSNPNVRDATLKVLDKKHISTKHLPETWKRTDEWYNYKDVNRAMKVLINLDEKSYEGGTNGDNHPITWCREFDGGRAWYTGLGHTKEVYKDEAFIEMLWGGIQYAAAN